MSEIEQQGPIGVVLAGGGSRRMGRDKTMLPWPPDAVTGGVPLWRHALDRLRRVCVDVVLADAGRSLCGESVPDGPGRGPAAGILGAAAARPGRDLLVLAADLPLVPAGLLGRLLELADAEPQADWIVPRRARGYESLCAVYRVAALDALRGRVDAGTFDLYGLAESKLRIRTVGDEELRRFGDPARLFLNVNRPVDWRRAAMSPSS